MLTAAILSVTDASLAGKTISEARWAEVVQHFPEPEAQIEFVFALTRQYPGSAELASAPDWPSEAGAGSSGGP
jgi:hypothetical protein